MPSHFFACTTVTGIGMPLTFAHSIFPSPLNLPVVPLQSAQFANPVPFSSLRCFATANSGFLLLISPPKDLCAPCPSGWTQAKTIVLFWLKIKVDIRATVNNAEAVLFECVIVRPCAVALMLFKSVERICLRKLDHQPIPCNFCCNRSE